MNQDNTSKPSGGSWADVAGRVPVKKQPTIALSFKSQERYRETHSELEVDPNHDSRFDPVILSRKTSNVVVSQQAVQGGGKNTQRQNEVDMRKIENGEIRLATSDRELSQKIQQCRISKGWTQDELNKRCSFPPHTIRNYENMTATAKQTEIDVMRRILGTQDLKKPRNIKMKGDNV